MLRSLITLSTAFVLAGCATEPFGQLSQQYTPTNMPTVAMKVFPNNFQLGVYSGYEKDGHFVPEKLIYDDQPNGDFGVFEAQPGQLVAILDVKPATSKGEREKFSICYQGGNVLAFTIPEQSEANTYYTANFHYRYGSGKLSSKVYDDYQMSKPELETQYPTLGELVKLEPKTLAVEEGC
ncbi:hypothetical protein J4N42_20210 [Vibrio sp. SCSIO 43135]|uniref:hypothetical protein n=1 Tax=Vibrio sp. SCSIO 43135 TaxID=2819096 RepID=UPI002075FA8A|nr:hypothetical protein [Vibrio sp. SCSIO 43135]USD42936.1 hypothetical protein J4N42_20210 [Vibrio sp. SCSIO 43135]